MRTRIVSALFLAFSVLLVLWWFGERVPPLEHASSVPSAQTATHTRAESTPLALEAASPTREAVAGPPIQEPEKPSDELARVRGRCVAVQFPRQPAAAADRRTVGWRAQSRAPREAPEERRQRTAAR
jgi:hypothetical protein